MAAALITIEGLDGAGKSTLAQGLARELGARGTEVELLREPGGVEASERIRELVQDPRLEVLPRAEALLYAAARAKLVEELLRPLLQRGVVVLLDPRVGRSRQQGRSGDPDRLEREDEDFFERVAGAYDQIAAAAPERVRVIDAGRSPEEVLAEALEAVTELLGDAGGAA